jgi:tetratricopeptide (TPR) repeat protein
MVLTLMLTTAVMKFDTRAAIAQSPPSFLRCFLFPPTCPPRDGGTGPDWKPPETKPLEELVARGEKTVDNYLTLGVLYSDQKNFSLAEERYRTALEIATATRDKQGEARAYAALGTLYTITNQRDQAISNFRQSRSILRTLGNRERENEVQREIQRLQRQSYGK